LEILPSLYELKYVNHWLNNISKNNLSSNPISNVPSLIQHSSINKY